MSLASTVQSRIGALAGGRVYLLHAPARCARPFIVWFPVTSAPELTHETDIGAGVLVATIVQVSCYAETALAAHDLRALAISAMADDRADTTLEDVERFTFENDVNLFCAQAEFTLIQTIT